MNKIYKSLDEMINEKKDENKEVLKELNKSITERKKEKKQKVIKIIILIIVIFSLFKIFIGEINLGLPIYYNYRLYNVTLNEKLITVCVDEYRKIPIIPFIINNDYVDLHCFHQDEEGTKTRPFNKGDTIYITINSFECFNSINNGKTSCYPYNNQRKKETNDTEYSLIIKRAGGAEKVMYNGDFVNDITDYFSEEGVYSISMIAKYRNVKSVVSFSIRIE
jgi:hypothetical protein